MPKGHKIGKRLRLGPFYVALRAAERRILKAALGEFGNAKAAANALGVSRTFFEQRAAYLGGVYEGHAIQEPPGKLDNARYDARAAGVPLGKATWKLRRFGRELKRKVPEDDSISDDHDPLLGVRDHSTREEESGGARRGAGEADPDHESGGE